MGLGLHAQLAPSSPWEKLLGDPGSLFCSVWFGRTGHGPACCLAAWLPGYPLKSDQPGNLQEVLLLETVVSWLRAREAVTVPKEPWKETPEEFAGRIRDICRWINQNYDVNGVCKSFPRRVQMVVDAEGDRINK